MGGGGGGGGGGGRGGGVPDGSGICALCHLSRSRSRSDDRVFTADDPAQKSLPHKAGWERAGEETGEGGFRGGGGYICREETQKAKGTGEKKRREFGC